MARPLRFQYPGAYLHIMSRGNARQDIFLSEGDRLCFLKLLEEVLVQFTWKCLAFVLMDNHYHLLIQITNENLSEGMRQLNGVYTQRFNRIHGRVGHVFQGRYTSIVVEKDTHLLECARYIILNPVRAGITNTANEWLWTSLGAIRSSEDHVPTVASKDVLSFFPGNETSRLQQFETYLQEGIDQKIRFDKPKGGILGSEAFIEQVTCGEILSGDGNFPIPQRMEARPTLDDIFPSDQTDLSRRNMAVVFARRTCKYKVGEIADHLGVHITTVSRILSRC